MMNDEFISELLRSFAANLTLLVSKLNLKVFFETGQPIYLRPDLDEE